PVVHLVAHLAIGIVKTVAERRAPVRVGRRRRFAVVVGEPRGARMAAAAGLDLARRRARRAALRGLAVARALPGDALAVVEGDRETLARVGVAIGFARPGDVIRARPVTRLACNV